MVTAPLSGVARRIQPGSGPGVAVLHLAVSRSAAVRLWPVAATLAGLGEPQALLDLEGPGVGDPETPPRIPDAEASAEAVEAAIERTRPASVLVAGDGDAAVAAAMVAFRHSVPIARLGAGLRCGDRGATPEINRLVLDELASLLLTDGDAAVDNLRAEGTADERIRRVGSTLPDVARRWQLAASRRRVRALFGVQARKYVLATLRGPQSGGDGERLARVAEAVSLLARRVQVVFCPHPATRAVLESMGEIARLRAAGVIVTPQLGYLDFLALETFAGAVLTDSAGVQEETTVLGVPCFTLGRGSERTLTLTSGTNTVVGDDPADIVAVVLASGAGVSEPIPLWDGGAGRRVAEELLSWNPA
jgi:UDP-N-acetylglucosamine 2-epimerase (non-hydrolysing)